MPRQVRAVELFRGSSRKRNCCCYTGAMAGQRLGQNFLAAPAWRARIAKLLHADPGERWLEIGAGHGEMTSHLAEHAARVVAIELDPKLAPQLHNRAIAWPNTEIVEADILNFPLEKIFNEAAENKIEGARWRVYGNLPYYITSPILHLLFQFADRISSAHVVMQLEVAERVTSQPACRDYGYLSVASQFFSKAKILLKIPPGAFRPRPKVFSALVELKFPGPAAEIGFGQNAREENAHEFLDFVQKCFAQKRKTLANNLKNYFADRALPPQNISELAVAADISESARAEELHVAQFADLFRAVAALRKNK